MPDSLFGATSARNFGVMESKDSNGSTQLGARSGWAPCWTNHAEYWVAQHSRTTTCV